MMIYKAINNINGKVYIGQTVRTLSQRISSHKIDTKNSSEDHFHRAIRKYGFDNFYWMVINKCDDIDTMNLLEQYYIKYYESMDRDVGYNMTSGGKNCKWSKENREERSGKNSSWYGKKHTEESKKRMSKVQKGHKGLFGEKNPMYGKIGKDSPNYGKPCSKETRKKISEATIGKKVTEETKHKMSKNHADMRGKNNPFYGKKHTDKTKMKIKSNLPNRNGKNNPQYGKPLTADHKLKKSIAMKKYYAKRRAELV